MERRTDWNFVGPQVRRLRVEREWTQEVLAAKCQVQGIPLTRGTLAKIEAGIRGAGDFEIYTLARVLKVPMETLFPGDMPQRLKNAFSRGE